MRNRARNSLLLRNAIFGIEDSLAATVGLLSGLAAENIPQKTLILTGLVYIFVEAFSMGVGSFLSEESAEDYDDTKSAENVTILASIVMFVSCVVAGLVPVAPYIFFDQSVAFPVSIGASVLLLAGVGAFQGYISKKAILPRIFRMVVLGGTAIAIGILVGKVVGLA